MFVEDGICDCCDCSYAFDWMLNRIVMKEETSRVPVLRLTSRFWIRFKSNLIGK